MRSYDFSHMRRIINVGGGYGELLAVDGNLLLIERMIPERLESSANDQLVMRADLKMLIGTGGRERTQGDFQKLLGITGFRINRVISIELSYNIIEAIPNL